MDNKLRNELRNVVEECRRLLEADFQRQLEGTYGIQADGRIEPLDEVPQLGSARKTERRAIEAALQHEQATGVDEAQSVERFVRESAFTALNRLAALKMMEQTKRDLIEESVGEVERSKGFKQFQLVSPEVMRTQPDGGYRMYLELLFDDLGTVLGALFDRSLPHSTLFPSSACLRRVLELLNRDELVPVWTEDETIGWIYQYFTPKEQRDRARRESSAPRNSYEMAFLNQFFTPWYVVAFLADNTLGKIWYEMRHGATRLVDHCEYMLRPSDDPIYERQERDPRSLRILDPACGSGHFLLYCFDLLRMIYEEAYSDSGLALDLQGDFPDRENFLRQIPRLILENNLYGVDIDLRATQIASLALWLRAQTAWADIGVRYQHRPRIERTHIVCAEPMPGDQQMLGAFLKDLRPVILGGLAREVWEKMRLAGEAGTLLKVEQELRAAIARARKAWLQAPQPVQLGLFAGDRRPQAVQLEMDLSEIKDDAFWEEAEARVLEQLESFASQMEDGGAVRRRLFTHDAAQGFAFIDLLQQPFDVVLMNPPFGSPTKGSKEYIDDAYPKTKNDVYAAFVERGLELLKSGGYLGAITSRTGFFLTSLERWRRILTSKGVEFVAMVDLGAGVLDGATVETAAYVIRKDE